MQLERTKQLVLLVDDEPDMLSMLKLTLKKKCDCEVICAPSAIVALELLSKHPPAVVVTDIKMPDMDGLELLKRIGQFDRTISTVIMTGYGTIDMAVQAIKDGAYDFLQKPFEKDVIVRQVKNCLERTTLLRTNQQLKKQLSDSTPPEGFVGQSPALKRALELLARVADTDATVLIRGESGTGKELAAKALHNLSNRKQRRMVTVNCPALPEHVLESELFGYSKGAFTGAEQEKSGLFFEAHGSTIVLDEIADIPVSLQTKLLRVLQEKEIRPLGQNKTIKVDVRVVASTNQDLEAKIKSGEFREDLFYRLNVVKVVMPNLEDMREDIPLLIHHFLSLFKKQYNKQSLAISTDVLQFLYQRSWQGNVRELQNYIKRLVLLADGEKIVMSQLQSSSGYNITDNPAAQQAQQPLMNQYQTLPYNDAKAAVIKDFSVRYIKNVLTLHGGNVTNGAAACGLERQALQRIMRRYGIRSTDFR